MLTYLRRQPERLEDPGRVHGVHRAVVRLDNGPPRLDGSVIPRTKGHAQVPLVLDALVDDGHYTFTNFHVVRRV